MRGLFGITNVELLTNSLVGFPVLSLSSRTAELTDLQLVQGASHQFEAIRLFLVAQMTADIGHGDIRKERRDAVGTTRRFLSSSWDALILRAPEAASAAKGRPPTVQPVLRTTGARDSKDPKMSTDSTQSSKDTPSDTQYRSTTHKK